MTQIRVLIVDDNEMFIEMARFVLTAAAYQAEAAADAQQALLKLPHFMPDLILMDIRMPGMDGIELTQRLKADPTTQHIVIVAFTAHVLQGDAQKLRAVGFDGYIAKPVDVMTLAADVRYWLKKPDGVLGQPVVRL